jgi:antitoxin component of MazEF toxin-antitoxin module
MEYVTSVKQIGGSAYLLLPPKFTRSHNLDSGRKMVLRESGDVIVMEKKRQQLDKVSRGFLNLNLDLGGMEVTREEIYETDRY